jgi:hypothetical protein
MITLSTLPPDYDQILPRVDRAEVRLLWPSGWYDGPIDGLLLYQGKKYWFLQRYDDLIQRKRTDEEGVVWVDHFARCLIIDISSEQLEEREYWHELFEEKVHAFHFDKDERLISGKPPRDTWKEFYDLVEDRPTLDLSQNVVVGWFELLWGSIEEEELDESRGWVENLED